MNTRELREKRKKLAEDANAILAAAVKEGRANTPDEITKYDAIAADIDALKATIDRIEKAEDEVRSFVPDSQRGRESATPDQEAEARAYNEAFTRFVLGGTTALSPEDVRALGGLHAAQTDSNERVIAGRPLNVAGQRGIRLQFRPARTALADFRQDPTGEKRAAQTITTSGGGYIIAREFSNEVERAMLFYGGMLATGRIIDTATGAPLDWPTFDDTSNQGRLLSINTTVTNTAITFGTLALNAYKYSSDSVLVPVELMQDSAFDMNSLVGSALGERLGRILNNHLTVGTGSSQPNGVITAATTGKTGTTGQTATVIYDDLVDLVYSVDRTYRQNGRFMLNDSSIKVIRKLKDGQGLPIWTAGGSMAGEPDRLLGYPIVVNNDVAAMTANAKSIAFGDFSRYLIRRVKDVTLLRLEERYADAHQVGFLAFARFDGNLVDAGQHPVKLYVNSAT